MDTADALRVFLATFAIMLAVVYSAKQAALAARDGSAPVHRGAPGSAASRVRLLFDLFRWLILAVLTARAVWPELDRFAGPISALEHPVIGLAGAAMLLGGAWCAFYAHTYMGALWRSGVPGAEAEGPEALLQRGPFARSRNPIFLGVQAAQIGLFLAWPSVFTAVCAAAGVIALQRQTRIEEAHLLARFGRSYQHYFAATPRWF